MGWCGSKVSPEDEDRQAVQYGDVDRKCRDVLCTVIFAVFCLGMTAIAAVGVNQGDPLRLVYATDYAGNTCGTGSSPSIAYFPRMNQDLLDANAKGVNPIDTTFYTLCVEKCPAVGDYVCNNDVSTDVSTTPSASVDRYFQTGPCWKVTVETSNIMFRCLPTESKNETSTARCVNPDGGYFGYTDTDLSNNKYYETINGINKPTAYCETVEVTTTTVGLKQGQDNPVFDQLSSIAASLMRWCGDVSTALALVLGCGLGLSLVGGLVYMLLFQLVVKIMVWGTILSVLFLGVVSSFVFSYKGGMIGEEALASATGALSVTNPIEKNADDNQLLYKVVAWFCIVFTLIIFVVILFLKKKVSVCVGIMREASFCLRRIPMLVLWPLVPYLALVVLLVYWAIVAAFVGSAGDITAATVLASAQASTNITLALNTTFAPESFSTSDISTYLGMYHFFGLLWINQLIQAISMCTIAGVVNKYYWTRDKSAKGAFGRTPILSSLYISFRYHFGSLCFGSLIIAICQFIRACLAYIDSKTKKLQQTNILIKIFMKAVQCFMCLLEKCLKWISKSAYIMIAMKGHSFCYSTREAVGLIWDNAAQMAVSNTIVSFMLLLAKMCISVASGLAFYFIVDSDEAYAAGGTSELSNPAVPLVLTFMIAFFVASTFMNVYGMIVDTILLLFCVDKKENKDKEGGTFMSNELKRLMGEKPQSNKGKGKGEDEKKAGAGNGSDSSDSDDEK